jgi:predicted Ser/Thr protein kinase
MIYFSCPSQDHPFIQIPKQYRRDILSELIQDDQIREKIFNEKQYEWIFRESPCAICSSVFQFLLDRLHDPSHILRMVHARRAYYNRQFGEGISIFNPGDPIINQPIENRPLQQRINNLLQTEEVKYLHSYLANTNNGVLALMDIKDNNVGRLMGLHSVISDGVHKVQLMEERIRSLFVGLVNPEDKKHYENVKSFQDRIITVNVPYVLDYHTEAAIYADKFGERIRNAFLPHVMNNLARIIIASRMEKDTPVIKKWINNPEKYKKYVDNDLFLLKMEVYRGEVPEWLSEEDVKRFNRSTRLGILEDSEVEGRKGISGRQSITLFSSFLMKYGCSEKLISMQNVIDFFENMAGETAKLIPDGFMGAIEDLYNFVVLQEVKEAIYFYNEKQISQDIQNYLFCINFEMGDTVVCGYTGDEITITDEYLKNFEAIFLGTTSPTDARLAFRKEVHHEYITNTLSRELRYEKKNIDKTTQFQNLFEKYIRNLKENALAPYAENENFRRAIMDYGKAGFNTYDDRLRRDIPHLFANLKKKFGYTEAGAKMVCLHVLDNDLVKKY